MLRLDSHTDAPEPYSDSAYNATVSGKARRKRYRHDKGKYVTNVKYLSKKIVSVDGEGITLADGSHSYVMLAIAGHKPLVNANGLSTLQVLRYLHSRLSSEDLNVIFGGSYDFNMWLQGIPGGTLERIYRANYLSKGVTLYGYQVSWQRGKGFTISKGDRKVVINDVISFFQCSFVSACDQYLQESPRWIEHREMIVREKAKRGAFDLAELETISNYNQIELILLDELVAELRERLNRVSLRPRRWNGPGAIASTLFQRERIKDHMETAPTPVATAARYAYMGGRFEMLKYGSVTSKVYEYDVNSAYPAALARVPSLAGGTWTRHDGDPGEHEFALYKVRYTGTRTDLPAPVAVRAESGTVSFPLRAENWIWGPEMSVLRKYCERVEGSEYSVLEAWTFRPAFGSVKPFGFVPAMYKQRQELKAAGDGAQLAIKLALNSMYGKLAQQVGWVRGTDKLPPRIPPYHQLEWAGFVTSWTRAAVLGAALDALDAVIAFETDALFSTRPLPVAVGSGLGEWELTEFDSLTYVQSGHYYGTKANGVEVVKCRGIDKGFVSRSEVERVLTLPEPRRILAASLTRFYGAGVAMARGLDDFWCRWITEPRNLSLYPTGKRVHIGCDACDGGGLTVGEWHTTICPVSGGASKEYPVEWINPNPLMTDLSDLRRTEVDYEND